MEEKFLYHIWDELHLAQELHTVSGKKLRIIYQGQFNTSRGPDFKNAIIEIDGEQLRGDIEIHLKTSDWQAHKHQEDIYYNAVILHVVLDHKAPYMHTILEDGKLIEVLELQAQLSDDISKLLKYHDSPHPPSVYCDLLSAIDNDALTLILHNAGLRRFKAKIARFNAALGMSSFDQLFYEGIFEALGYSKNKLNTLQLAQSLPLTRLREWKHEGMSKVELAAIYLCSSGLLSPKSAALDVELRNELWRVYEAQAWHGKKLSIDWQLFRIRPQNHPIKRLIYITDLIWNTLDSGLLKHFIDHTQLHTMDPKLHYKAYCALWQPSEIMRAHPQSLGKSVRDNIYLNIYLPVLSLYSQKISGDPHLVLKLYKEFPALQDNHVIRFMARYMSSDQCALTGQKAIYQQGLLDIFNRFCSWHFCHECREYHRS